MRAGFSVEGVNAEQWRFASETLDEFLEHLAVLQERLKGPQYAGLVSLAVAGAQPI